jgi:segregation and condensation protein B
MGIMAQTPEPPSEPPKEQGISLDELAAAYAQSMGGRAEQAAPPEEPQADQQTTEASEDPLAETPEDGASADAGAGLPLPDAEPSDDDPCPVSPATILEAMLFVGNQQNEPLCADRAAELMRGVKPEEIPALIDGLNRRYAANRCPYRIVGEKAGYRLALDKAFEPVRNRFYGRVREARLSQAALDVLAIVAYRQPVTSEEVNRLRDTPSSHILSQLVRRQLLRIERLPEKPRHPTYHTTDRFLELFGIESLDDLPQVEDLEGR